MRRVGKAIVEGLLIAVGDDGLLVRSRESQDGHVLIEVVTGLGDCGGQGHVDGIRLPGSRTRQRDRCLRGARDLRRAGHDVLHGLLWLDPWPAAARPARPGVQGDLKPEPLRLEHGMLEQGPPRLTHEVDRAPGNADVHLHDDHAADAGLAHRFEVSGDALAAQVAVHPEPVHPRPRSVRRLPEPLFQLSRKAAAHQARGDAQ